MQVYNNYQHGDSSPWMHVDGGAIAQAAVGGALIGATLGLAAPSIAAGVTAGTAALGSGAGLSAAATFANATYELGPVVDDLPAVTDQDEADAPIQLNRARNIL